MSASSTAPSRLTSEPATGWVPITDYTPALQGLKNLQQGIDEVTTDGVFQATKAGIKGAITALEMLKGPPARKIIRVEVVHDTERYKGTPRTGVFMFDGSGQQPTLFIPGLTLADSSVHKSLITWALSSLGIYEKAIEEATASVRKADHTVVFWHNGSYWEWFNAPK